MGSDDDLSGAGPRGWCDASACANPHTAAQTIDRVLCDTLYSRRHMWPMQQCNHADLRQFNWLGRTNTSQRSGRC